MTHLDVKNLHEDIIALINHIIEKKADIYHVSYGLDKNYQRLKDAVELINKNLNKELVVIEEKVRADADEKKLAFDEAFKMLSKEEKEKHADLMVDYLKDMAEPNDFEIYYLNPDKLEGLKIEYPYFQILKKFLPKED